MYEKIHKIFNLNFSYIFIFLLFYVHSKQKRLRGKIITKNIFSSSYTLVLVCKKKKILVSKIINSPFKADEFLFFVKNKKKAGSSLCKLERNARRKTYEPIEFNCNCY